MKTMDINKIAYVWNTEDGYAKYTLFIESRPVMDFYAHTDETDRPIYIAKPGSDERIKTEAFAFTAKGEDRISSVSINVAAMKYLVKWFADLYVPKGN